ncbi:hypothetical protein GOP47_0024580 [Adiantum capillus-veneris]|uniref:Uncharacterized protein n=1 Tax=Adiantum capillus-veneris TaxID=13818 RepID=A0A9D4Z3S5_ADICA|nr:hypothetical protein GOP47_0024580 [Adiantum capillus-veneris]
MSGAMATCRLSCEILLETSDVMALKTVKQRPAGHRETPDRRCHDQHAFSLLTPSISTQSPQRQKGVHYLVESICIFASIVSMCSLRLLSPYRKGK